MRPTLSINLSIQFLTLFCSLQTYAQNMEFASSLRGTSSPVYSLGSSYQLPPKNLPLWMRGGRSGLVRQITFIENGKFVVTRAEDVTTYVESVIRVHEFSSGKLVQTLRFIGSSSAVSHNGRLLAIEKDHVDYTYDLHIWNLQQGTGLKSFEAPGAVYQIVFSADDKTIAGCGRHGFVSVWEVETGTRLRSYDGFTEDAQCVMFSPDEKFLIAKGGKSKESEIRIWETNTGVLKSTIATNSYEALPLAISPNGEFFAFGESSGQITLMDFPTGRRIGHYSTKEKFPQTLTFSPDSKMLLLGSDGFHDMHTGDDYENTLLVWRTHDTTSQMELTGHSSDVRSSAFTPDGRFIACGLENGNVPLWDSRTGTMVRKDVSRTSHIKAAAFSLDGKSVLTFDGQGVIHRWDSRSGDSLSFRQSDQDIGSAATILPRYDIIAASRPSERVIILLSASTGKSVKSISAGGGEIECVTLSPDGRFLLASSQQEIFLWETKTGRRLRRFNAGFEPRICVAFSRDAKQYAASLCNSKRILVWKTDSKEPPIDLLIEENHLPQRMMFSSDGNYLAAAYDYGPVRIWDLAHKKVEKLLDPESSTVAYSPDGKYLATSDIYGTIDIWDATTYSSVAKLNTAFRARYEMLEWSADQKFLLGFTSDAAVAVWNVPELMK